MSPSPREVEVAAERWTQMQGYTDTRRALRTKYARVDFFGSDIIGRGPRGKMWVQVTMSQREGHVRERRRKLERGFWEPTDKRVVLQLRSNPDPAFRGRDLFFFRVHRLLNGVWVVDREAAPVPREWFRAHPPAEGRER